MSQVIAEMIKKMADLEHEQARNKEAVLALTADVENLRELLQQAEHRAESLQKTVTHWEGVEYGG